MDYHSMKRRELQALCKKHNIPANSANSVLADKLSELLNEKQKPITQQRTCIKSSVEMTDKGEPAVSKRQSKKVRFSPNNDLVEYHPDKKHMAMVTNTKVQRKSVAKKVDKSIISDSNSVELIEDGAETLVKLTRSRAQGKQAIKDAEKGHSVVKGTGGYLGRVTRLKAHTTGEEGVDENKPRKRAVKDVENASESVDETVVDRVRVTRSSAETKRSGKQVAKDVRTVEQSKEIMGIPARVTRSRGQTSNEGIKNTVNDPSYGKKRTRREMKHTDTSTNLSSTAPEDDQNLPKRKSMKTRGVKNMDEDETDKVEVVNESRVTRLKSHPAKKSGRNNKIKTENKVEEPLKHAVKKNVTRRKSVVQVKNTESVLRLEEPVKRRTRQSIVMEQSKVQSDEVKENVTRSRKNASENEKKAVSNASGSLNSRKRRSSAVIENKTVEAEFVSSVDESPNGSVRSVEGNMVAGKQMESSFKTPASRKNVVTRDNSSNKRSKLSGTKRSDLINNSVKSTKDGSPVSEIRNFELNEKVIEPEVTPAIDESRRRFTRSAIRNERKEPLESAIKEQYQPSSLEVAKIRADPVFSTAPGRITRSGIKVGRNSASNAAERIDKNKLASQSAHQRKCFDDDAQIFSPEVAEVRPSLDVTVEPQSDEVKENVTRSRKHAENESKSVSNASGSLRSRTRRGTIVIEDQTVEAEFVSPVDESPNGSVRSVEGNRVAGKQLESSLKTPASRKNAVTRGNSSKIRSKLSRTKQSDSMEHTVKSNKDESPVSEIGNFELDENVIDPKVTPVIDASRGRFTRSAIRSEIKERNELAIEEQSQLPSHEVAKFRADPVFSTAPGRITRSGIKVGRNPASNFAKKVNKNKLASQSAHQRERFDDDAQIFSPEVAEVGPNPDVTVAQSEIGFNPDVTMEPLPEIRLNPDVIVAPSEISLSPDVTTEPESVISPSSVVPIEFPSEIRLNPDVDVEFQSEMRRNPDLAAECQFDISPDPDLALESQCVIRPNADVTVESESGFRPNPNVTVESEYRSNPDATIESQFEIRPNPVIIVESLSEITPNPDVPVESQSAIRPNPDVTKVSQSEIRPNLDFPTGTQSEIKPNPDVPTKVQSESAEEMTVQILESADLSALKSVRLPTEVIEQNQDSGTVTAAVIETVSPMSGENRDSHELSNGSFARAKDSGETLSGESIFNIKRTPFLMGEFAETVADAISDRSTMQNQNVDVKSSLSGEAEVPVAVTIQIVEANENISVYNSLEDEENKVDSVSYNIGSKLSFEQSDVKSKTKRVEVPDENDIEDDIHEIPGVGKSDVEVVDFGKEYETEHESEVMQSTGDDTKKIPISGKSDSVDDKCEAAVTIQIPDENEVNSLEEEDKDDSVSYNVGFKLSFEQSDVKSKTKEVEVPDKNDIEDNVLEIPGLGKSDVEVVDFGKIYETEHESEVMQSTGDDAKKIPISGKSDCVDDQCETGVLTARIVLEDPALSGEVDAREIDPLVGEYYAEPKNDDSPDQSVDDEKFFQGLATDEYDTKYDRESDLKSITAENVEEDDVLPDQHENMPVLSEIPVNPDLSTSKEAPQNSATIGNDDAVITSDVRDEFVLDINKDAFISDGLENTTNFTDAKNYSRHEKEITGVQSKESESVSSEIHHALSGKVEQKVETADHGLGSGKFIEDDSNLGVDVENPTREEYSPKEDDINKQEENQNTTTYVDWGDYGFQVDEYQKPVSANESDEVLSESEKDDHVSDIPTVKNVDEDSNLGVDIENPTREEYSPKEDDINKQEENQNTTYVDWGDYGFQVDEYQKPVSANESDEVLGESEKDDRGSDIPSVNNVYEDSNLDVDVENPTREESAAGDTLSDPPKEDDINKQEENRNTTTYVDWGVYGFQVDEYQKPVSANESDEVLGESEKDDRVSDIPSVKNVDEDSKNAADEKSNKKDLLKGNVNADTREEFFNWPDSSLKSLSTPVTSQIRHLKHGQDDAESSLRTLFATPAAAQISHLKDVEADAVSFAFSVDRCNDDIGRKGTPTLEFNNQLEIESSKDFNRENELFGDANFDDYSRKYFEDEGGSSDMSAKNKHFEFEDNNQADKFKQYDLSYQAAGTSNVVKDYTIHSGEFEKKEENQLQGSKSDDYGSAFDKGM